MTNAQSTRAIVCCLVVLILCSAAGCSTTQSYDLAVRNETSRPLTIWLTKDGPEDEPAWRSPEDMAIDQPGGQGGPIPGVVIAAGKTAHTKIDGKFASNTRAILRFYRGQLHLNEILAISRGSPDRLDIYLPPGPSHIIVRDADDGHLAITPVKSFGADTATGDKPPDGNMPGG
jgi:hypothetical protein